MEDYAQKNGYTNIRHFTDDGYSGVNFNRPGFQAMISEIEAGNVETLIVKDMSRLGRNYLQVGFYTEILFPQKKVHFLAINNSIDSNKASDNDFAPFLNIMNEWYAKDTSNKIRSVFDARMKDGKRCSGSIPYGYNRVPSDKQALVVDPVAAEVVKRIFLLANEGKSTRAIAEKLTEEKVLIPSAYAKEYHPEQYNGQKYSNPNLWGMSTVRGILERQEYLGHTVLRKTVGTNFKLHKRKSTAQDEQYLFQNTHEPILWSKRCKDPALRGTVRETIHQVSHSKKWASNIPLKDEQGQPVLRSNGKPKYRPSYSILQDELVAHMQEHGFTNFQRGELGSTRENLTSLQYQIEKDKERLANIQERVEAAQTKYEAAWNVRKTESEIDDMGKKTITGKYTVSKEDYKQLTALAKEGITSRQEIHKLNEDISLYKKQYIDCKYDLRDTQSAYAALRRRSEPFLQALKYFPQFAKGFAEKIADLLEHREAQQKKEREEAKRNPHRASARRQDDQDLER